MPGPTAQPTRGRGPPRGVARAACQQQREEGPCSFLSLMQREINPAASCLRAPGSTAPSPPGFALPRCPPSLPFGCNPARTRTPGHQSPAGGEKKPSSKMGTARGQREARHQRGHFLTWVPRPAEGRAEPPQAHFPWNRRLPFLSGSAALRRPQSRSKSQFPARTWRWARSGGLHQAAGIGRGKARLKPKPRPALPSRGRAGGSPAPSSSLGAGRGLQDGCRAHAASPRTCPPRGPGVPVPRALGTGHSVQPEERSSRAQPAEHPAGAAPGPGRILPRWPQR